MKINKAKFVELFAKHLGQKVGDVSNMDLTTLTASVLPSFNAQVEPLLRKFNLIDDDYIIDLSALKEKLLNTFKFIPMLRVPMGPTTMEITEYDIQEFFKDAEKFGFEDTKVIECKK